MPRPRCAVPMRNSEAVLHPWNGSREAERPHLQAGASKIWTPYGAARRTMRLDKFLKVSRLAKRRTAAKEALDAGRIECGGHPVKPAHVVKPGDELLIRYASRDVRVR